MMIQYFFCRGLWHSPGAATHRFCIHDAAKALCYFSNLLMGWEMSGNGT